MEGLTIEFQRFLKLYGRETLLFKQRLEDRDLVHVCEQELRVERLKT